MSPELEKYYNTNYTKCNCTNDFLASWQGVAYPCHTLQAIALPFQLLTFWIIINKTPANMKSMKFPLLFNHIW
ncbi:hypothetical protein CRE_05041 [Caenorhabditis remanei]|uniref:Uncharacterized protein n=1 Tax=Caenorhabditis remanei TaxID=31234 RepID=E3MZ68_CAERE|nr:hypothetical protein CRE_05041 [Caenorhabditis remanei]